MLNLLQTERTYKTYANAEAALKKAVAKYYGENPDVQIRYLIACNAEGRFAPVVVGNQFIPFAVIDGGITVVS